MYLPCLQKIEIDFAAAEDHSAGLLFVDLFAIRDDQFEFAVGQVAERRYGHLVPQQAFRRHDDQRLPV